MGVGREILGQGYVSNGFIFFPPHPPDFFPPHNWLPFPSRLLETPFRQFLCSGDLFSKT
jgi:hypothetical protein